MATIQSPTEIGVDVGVYDPSQLDVKLGKLALETDQHVLQEPTAVFTLSPETTQELGSDDEVLDIVSPTSSATASQASSRSLSFRTAFEDARHFAGGLVSHPYESSKHYSVMRHSHGLVYFKGFNTNVAVSVFGDQPLPGDRQFWLQRRGYSGKTGLKLGASVFGNKAAWINVTPTTRCRPDQLPAGDERAWRRDIEKFLRKAGKQVRAHRPLETCILRVPCSADDGYFRVVLCAGEKGKKTLCPSPIFRLVSTSTNMGSLRGASLSTMPLELGIKIGQFAARKVAMNAAAPVAGQAAQQAKSLMPWKPSGFVQQQAVSTAQGSAQSRFEDAHEQSEEAVQARLDRYVAHVQESVNRAELIGAESGPEAPYPIQFPAKLFRHAGAEDLDFALLQYNLGAVADDVVLRLSGTYFGWAKVGSAKGLVEPSDFFDKWHHAVLAVSPRSDVKASSVMKKAISICLANNDYDADLTGSKVKLMLMGRIRSAESHHHFDEARDVQKDIDTLVQDIATAQICLDRPAWAPETVLDRVRSDKSNRSLNERYADARGSVQKGVDRVPVHYAGVRTDSMALRDRLVGNGGVWVTR